MTENEFFEFKQELIWLKMNELSEKEQEFIESLQAQSEEYGRFMHLSEKMENWFNSIKERVNDNS